MSLYRFMFVNLLDVEKRNRFMKEAEQINVRNLCLLSHLEKRSLLKELDKAHLNWMYHVIFLTEV